MRLIASAALISAILAASSLAAPALAQTATSANPALMAGMTVRDGSDAGPTHSGPAQADDASSLADLPRIATHAPTPLGRRVPDSQIADSQ